MRRAFVLSKYSVSLLSLAMAAFVVTAPTSPRAAPAPLPQHKPVAAAKTNAATPAVKPAVKLPAKSTPAPSAKTAALPDDAALPVTDTQEGALPDYPPHALTSIGRIQTYVTNEEDTFIDIARNYDLGYVELRAANPKVDAWAPLPGTTVVIPSFKLIPRAPQNGIIVNLGEMRLYYFSKPGAEPFTHPLGIGREGLNTPTGTTSIIRKVAGPSWYPTARMRKEEPWLPAAVPPGPANPLGTHALYLGWPEIRIHGSNKPWGIGRRVSSGCMRMYPEDIIKTFDAVPVGAHVTVVDQPVLVAWVGGTLYLEANPSKIQSNEIEVDGTHTTQRPLTAGLRETIIRTAGKAAPNIEWDIVNKVMRERRGVPVAILAATAKKTQSPHVLRPQQTTVYQYNN